MSDTFTIPQKPRKDASLSPPSLKSSLVLLGMRARVEGDMALVELVTRLIRERRWGHV
jgi:hypothetical protein